MRRKILTTLALIIVSLLCCAYKHSDEGLLVITGFLLYTICPVIVLYFMLFRGRCDVCKTIKTNEVLILHKNRLQCFSCYENTVQDEQDVEYDTEAN
jgi:hypothetical protein